MWGKSSSGEEAGGGNPTPPPPPPTTTTTTTLLALARTAAGHLLDALPHGRLHQPGDDLVPFRPVAKPPEFALAPSRRGDRWTDGVVEWSWC